MTISDWTRDEVVDACLEALATGCVMGVPIEADPEDLATRIARPFEQEYFAEGLAMTRDWGLYKGFYSRAHQYGRWTCDGVELRTHRMEKPPTWTRIPEELRRRGFAPLHLPDDDADLDRYAVAASAAAARVGHTDSYVENGRLYDVDISAAPLLGPSKDLWGPLRTDLRALGKAGPGAWPAWLAEHRPTVADYAGVFTALHVLHGDQPARDDRWAALGRWFLDRAREAFPAGEWTYHWALFVADHPELAPAADVSRDCLAALPMTIDEARAIPADWRKTTPEDVRRARMTRALLRIAADAAPDPALEEWRRETRWLY